MAQIRIKRSTGSSAPSSSDLANAELAFTEGNDILYYGEGTSGSNAASVIKVGGSGAFCDLTTAQTVAGDKTFSDDVVVTGNLTVNGTTTTVATANTTLEDNLLELNSGANSNANDCGLLIERGNTGDNAFIGWDESEDKFLIGTTSGTASSTGNLTVTTGTLIGNLVGGVTGNVSGSSGSCTGNAATATSAGTLTTARTIGGTSFDGSANIAVALAATATTLATARTIAGVSFDGSANISLNNNAITNGAGYITGSGDTTGNATTATTATNATHVFLTDNESTNENNLIPFAEDTTATGNTGLETDGDFHYNPSTGKVTATEFAGLIDGGTWS